MTTMYKRNAKGLPIFWRIELDAMNLIKITHGIVGKSSNIEYVPFNAAKRKSSDEIKSLIKLKRKEGYKELSDLYDNAPKFIEDNSLESYLNTYLPKFNTHADGKFIPMLCKTLQDNKPFEKNNYFGQWKINGERCIITAERHDDLFNSIKLYYRSREGIDWTDKLSYLDDILIPRLHPIIIDMMVEEGVGLDGELYIPGYKINEINSFIKNENLPQHYILQYWLYDLCVENMSAINRHNLLIDKLAFNMPHIGNIEDHMNVKQPLVLLPAVVISDISEATKFRDLFIDKGFEGLIVRNVDSEYQFGGKRNNAMLKYKKIFDGRFSIVDIKEDKRGLPIFTLKNDINDELFDATINLPQDQQKHYLVAKDSIIAKGKAFVEYRERSGIKEVPFHAKIIKIDL